jgi:hypothetical protein
MTVSNLPAAPARTMEPATFATTADAFVAALVNLPSEINSTAATINSQAATVATNTATSTTDANNAAASATAAATAASAAAWVNGGTYALNASAISQINFQTYRKITASSVTTTDPALDSTNWTPISVTLIRGVVQSANNTLGVVDNGKIIYGSGTYTQNIGNTTNQKAGWYVYVRNTGSGDITITSSNLVDGLSSYIMYSGETRLFVSDGTNFNSVILTSFYRVWTTTASNNFTKPPGYNYFEGLAWSGGGGGGKQPTSNLAIGGGGGGCFPFKIRASDLGATETISIGGGGAARTTNGSPNAGGETSIGSKIFVAGGSSSGSGYGGAISLFSGNVPITQSTGGLSVGFETASSPTGGSAVWGGASATSNGTVATYRSVYGGGNGGTVDGSNVALAAGFSIHAGNGGAASVASNGTDGTIPAGGGGATQTGTQSGAGARGEVRMWGVC